MDSLNEQRELYTEKMALKEDVEISICLANGVLQQSGIEADTVSSIHSIQTDPDLQSVSNFSTSSYIMTDIRNEKQSEDEITIENQRFTNPSANLMTNISNNNIITEQNIITSQSVRPKYSDSNVNYKQL